MLFAKSSMYSRNSLWRAQYR